MHQEIKNYPSFVRYKRGYESKPGLRLPPDFSGPKSVIEKISNFAFIQFETKKYFQNGPHQGRVFGACDAQEKPLKTFTFMDAMRPWKNVDWHDEELCPPRRMVNQEEQYTGVDGRS